MRGLSHNQVRLAACLPVLAAALVSAALPDTPSSWPHDYPGKPAGDFSPAWQSCASTYSTNVLSANLAIYFTVPAVSAPRSPFSAPRSPTAARHTDFEVTAPLANVTFPLPRNFAGNVGVNRAGHPNNTLFFWAFERENGSLTAAAGERAAEPWGIWLNGGCVRACGRAALRRALVFVMES